MEDKYMKLVESSSKHKDMMVWGGLLVGCSPSLSVSISCLSLSFSISVTLSLSYDCLTIAHSLPLSFPLSLSPFLSLPPPSVFPSLALSLSLTLSFSPFLPPPLSGLSWMSLQFGFLSYLVFFEYDWDIMEPVTYFVGTGTSILLFSYFILTRQVL